MDRLSKSFSMVRWNPDYRLSANREGLGHIAFAVDDVEATRANVLANGGSDIGQIVEAEIDGVGRLSFCYVADPEGNIIELQKWG